MATPDQDVRGRIPTATFRGVVKQLSLAELNQLDWKVLALCLPEFRHQARQATPLDHLGVRTLDNNPYQPRLRGWGRLRRFAGSTDFGPGRYYSVCTSEDGFDCGTLINELMTYWHPGTMVFPTLTDSTLLSPQERASHPELETPTLGVHATRFKERVLLLRKRRVEKAGELVHVLPLSVRSVEIPNVIDLRIPDAQVWFFNQFVTLEEELGLRGHHSGTSVVEFPKVPGLEEDMRLRGHDPGTFVIKTCKGRGVRDFADLLPTLVVGGIGGSTFHQAVGAWLRSHDVAGLVYPSARSNVYWRLRDTIDEPEHQSISVEFSGWNLVDYRGSGPAEWEPLFGHLSTWVLPMKAGVSVHRFDAPQSGWEIQGAEEGERRRIHLGFDMMLGRVKKVVDYDPRGGFRRPFYNPLTPNKS